MPVTVLYLDHTAKWSGGEIALLRTLYALNPEKVRPVVALAAEGPFAERLRSANIKTYVLPLAQELREARKDSLGTGKIQDTLGAVAAFTDYAHQLTKIARSENAAIIHCNSLKSDIYGAVTAKLTGLPLIWHVRDHIDTTYLPATTVKMFRTLAKTVPSFVIANSESTLTTLFPEGTGKQQAAAIHDGLSVEELLTLPPHFHGWRYDPPRIGMVGRLTEWKGQHIFLQAAEKLLHQGIEAEYILIGAPLFGEEAYEKRLREQARVLGERAVFMGFQADVPRRLRELDICVHASIIPEPFGQVVIEAMAEGLPVVASDGGGVREIVLHNHNGLLTPMGDAEALAKTLSNLLSNPRLALWLAKNAHEYVRQHFTADGNARKIEAVYDELLRRKGKAEP